MRQLLFTCGSSTLLLVFTACHSAPPPPPATESTPAPASTSLPAAVIQPAAQSTSPPKPRPAASAKSNPQVAQLDLDTEGGTRDGSYAMWVHVSEAGKPVPDLPVRAYSPQNRIVAAARTNADGDAQLLVQLADYRIVANQGKRHAERSVTYHPGNQFDLELAP